MQRYGAVFSPPVLLPRNPKSNDTMSCPFSCASSVRFRQCGSFFARDVTQAEHHARKGMWDAECNSLSTSLASAGAFFTRASRPSSMIPMSAAFTGLATSAPQGPAEIQLSPTRSQGFAAHLTTETPSSLLLLSLHSTLTPLLCQLCHTQRWIHHLCPRTSPEPVSPRRPAHEHRSIDVHVFLAPTCLRGHSSLLTGASASKQGGHVVRACRRPRLQISRVRHSTRSLELSRPQS